MDILEFWNSRTPEFKNFGILELWSFRISEFSNFRILDFEILEFGNLKFFKF